MFLFAIAELLLKCKSFSFLKMAPSGAAASREAIRTAVVFGFFNFPANLIHKYIAILPLSVKSV